MCSHQCAAKQPLLPPLASCPQPANCKDKCNKCTLALQELQESFYNTHNIQGHSMEHEALLLALWLTYDSAKRRPAHNTMPSVMMITAGVKASRQAIQAISVLTFCNQR
jgi:hypothetical protein